MRVVMNELEELATGLAAELRRRQALGTRRIATPAAALVPEPVPASPSPAPSPDLDTLRTQVAACTACDLCQTRTQTVFQDGTGSAGVLFIGEAPGQQEDEQGVPFVGRAGQLLTDIIKKGMGLDRSQVAIANVLKCRPPANRDPLPEEKARCTPFLDRQIELLDPKVIIPLGLHASRHVLGSTLSMGRLRGRVHSVGGRKVVPTYHPAYLLRSPSMKKECWQDIQLALAELGLPRP
jgi:uracil-DNA glycosylase family 4